MLFSIMIIRISISLVGSSSTLFTGKQDPHDHDEDDKVSTEDQEEREQEGGHPRFVIQPAPAIE